MTTLLVSTVGGHLAQLHSLVPRLAGLDTDDRLWVTHRTEQSESLLANEDVIWVPYIEERDVVGVLRALRPALRQIGAKDVQAVVSTGSAIAVAYLAAARLRKRRAVFIESIAFTRSRSRTARIVQNLPGVSLYTQSVPTSSSRWRYRGSVLDDFCAERGAAVEPRRLVVTVGTSQTFGYRRLFERLLAIVPDGIEVLWQTGSTDTRDLDLSASPWIPHAELTAAMANADVVIAHAGGGSTLDALASGRRPILVPRIAAQGDFNDDHQLELADLLAVRDLACVRDVEAITWDDIVDAASWQIHRVDNEPIFDLDAE